MALINKIYSVLTALLLLLVQPLELLLVIHLLRTNIQGVNGFLLRIFNRSADFIITFSLGRHNFLAFLGRASCCHLTLLALS
jgi:hypothetical protein